MVIFGGEFASELGHQVCIVAEATKIDDRIVRIEVHVEHRHAGEVKTQCARFNGVDARRLVAKLRAPGSTQTHRPIGVGRGAAAVAGAATPAQQERQGREFLEPVGELGHLLR